jgi:hypothetical protein
MSYARWLDANFLRAVGPRLSKVHRAGFRAYAAFSARAAGSRVWPPDRTSLRRFATHLGVSGYAAGTIRAYVSAIQVLAQIAGVMDHPILDRGRIHLIAAFASLPGRRRGPSVALDPAALIRMARAVGAGEWVFLAMLLFQLYAIVRAESVVGTGPKKAALKAVRCGDLRVGSNGVHLLVRNWKHRLGGSSWELLPEGSGSVLCPVRAFDRFVAERPRGRAFEPLFVGTDGRAVSYQR